VVVAATVVTLLIGTGPSGASPPGTTRPGGEPGVAGACTAPTGTPKRQLRGFWIATVSNIDWPSRAGLPPAAARAEFTGWLDLAVRLHFNAVFVQIRPGGDAFWPSRYEPWSRYLTGVPGRDPGWDPLAFMITEAHRRNLEFHAWFNPYRVSSAATGGTDLARLAPGAPGQVHPDWLVAYPVGTGASRLYYNPGMPQVRRFVEDAIMDAVSRYDVDGVHFDDFFYPYPAAGQDFPDGAAFAAYGAGYASRAQWRRHNIDLLIHELHDRIHASKPWVSFGVSPFGIWRNARTDPAGSATTGLQSYDANFADTRGWVAQGWLDYIAPQLYWHIGFHTADYAVLLRWWARVVAGTGVHLYIGQAAYRVGVAGQPRAWWDPAELARHLAANREYPQVSGDIYFSARSLRADRLGAVSRLAAAYYQRPALPPAANAAPPGRVAAPEISVVRRQGGRVTLGWRAVPGAGTARPISFAVYRFGPGQAPGACGLADADHLVATVRGLSWTDPAPAGARSATYYVTAVSRAGQESRPSAPARAR
jgi:uncharacterized lipoprotein YddW (UPF0748 family)